MLTVVNVPNLLSLLRLVAIPCFLILLSDERYGEALAVFVAAGVTDALDGAIARLMHAKTTVGAYLDPAADKLLLMSSFIALSFMREVPRWLTVIVLSRDVIIVLGYFLLFAMTRETMEVRPSVVGKGSTFFQLCSVTSVLVALIWPQAVSPLLRDVVFAVTGVFTTAAGLGYLYRGLAWLQSHETAAPSP